jgi:predicted transcriptional regulator
MTATKSDSFDALSITAEIVAAFVGNNSLPRADLPALIEAVSGALGRLAGGQSLAAAAEPVAPTPAVSVRKSIAPDYLICLDDGLKFKSLKRHLATLGMTAEQYREKWSLPKDYPMVAPNYAAVRSAMAKKIGLGQMRNASRPAENENAAKGKSKPGRGRPRKATA